MKCAPRGCAPLKIPLSILIHKSWCLEAKYLTPTNTPSQGHFGSNWGVSKISSPKKIEIIYGDVSGQRAECKQSLYSHGATAAALCHPSSQFPISITHFLGFFYIKNRIFFIRIKKINKNHNFLQLATRTKQGLNHSKVPKSPHLFFSYLLLFEPFWWKQQLVGNFFFFFFFFPLFLLSSTLGILRDVLWFDPAAGSFDSNSGGDSRWAQPGAHGRSQAQAPMDGGSPRALRRRRRSARWTWKSVLQFFAFLARFCLKIAFCGMGTY